MKCQILFSGKNKKNLINLLSAESAHSVLSVNVFFLLLHQNIACYMLWVLTGNKI